MSKRVLLLHGWGGSDSPHWQAWLAGELAKDYGKVSFLKFSDYDFPNIDAWKKELLAELTAFKPEIVVCHSLANTLWFHLCNDKSIKQKLELLLLVAPPSNTCKIEELQSFFPLSTPSKLYTKKTILVTSSTDPYLTQKEATELQSTLHVEMQVLENAGHINADSGYGEWPWVLHKIKEI